MPELEIFPVPAGEYVNFFPTGISGLKAESIVRRVSEIILVTVLV